MAQGVWRGDVVAGSVNRGQGRQLLLIVFRRLPPLKVRERIFFFFSMSLFLLCSGGM